MKNTIRVLLFFSVMMVSPIPKKDAISQQKTNDSIAKVDHPAVIKESSLDSLASIASPVDSSMILEYKELIQIRDDKVKQIIAKRKAAERKAANEKFRADQAEQKIQDLQDQIRILSEILEQNCQPIVSNTPTTIQPIQDTTAAVIPEPVFHKSKKKNIFARGWKSLKKIF